MKYYLIAGEASGDLHGSNLIKALKKIDSQAEFRGFGGNLMKKEGAVVVKHYKEMAYMGVWEVITHLGTIKKNMAFCKSDILTNKPDALILIDYAGFNLRIARYIYNEQIPVFYYIAPKAWAWKKSRVRKLIRYTKKVFSILPFEKTFFEKHGLQIEYVGNPLVDAIDTKKKDSADFNAFCKRNHLNTKPIIAMLAGSRKQEIRRCLPEMLKAIENISDFQFVIAGVSFLHKELYELYTENKNVHLIFDQTYDLLAHSKAAIVTSGTATLETAIFKVPQVVIYKTSMATFIIARPFVHIKFFSLVNLIMDNEVVKEYFQFNLAKKIKCELHRIIHDTEYREQMIANYNILQHKLGNPGTSERVAGSILKHIKYHD